MRVKVRENKTSPAPDGVDKSLVGFEVGGVRYAIDIHRVREIIRPMPTLELPHVPEMVSGVVDHRGNVVPIIDLRVRFGVGSGDDDREVRWVIVTRGDRLVALAVDRVSEVFSAGGPAAREVPEIGVGEEARGITAAYSHRGTLVFVVDADTLTSVTDELVLPSADQLEVGDGHA